MSLFQKTCSLILIKHPFVCNQMCTHLDDDISICKADVLMQLDGRVTICLDARAITCFDARAKMVR